MISPTITGRIEALYKRGEFARADRKVAALATSLGLRAEYHQGACRMMAGAALYDKEGWPVADFASGSYRLPDGCSHRWGREPSL